MSAILGPAVCFVVERYRVRAKETDIGPYKNESVNYISSYLS